jgi:transposase
VAALRAEGLSVSQIAQRLGVPRSTCYKDVLATAERDPRDLRPAPQPCPPPLVEQREPREMSAWERSLLGGLLLGEVRP